MESADAAPQPLSGSPARWALGVFAVLFVLFFFRAIPLGLDPVRTDNAPGQFDTERAVARLARVLDGTPHPVDSDALDATRARLLTEIRQLGYAPDVRAHDVCRDLGAGARCARVENIFFTAGPQEGPALVLTAHYDSVEASPGFGDDGIGLAVWLEVAHHLKQQLPSRPVAFLITDGEEAALLGAQAFVEHPDEYPFTPGRIINLEARGVRGPAMMFETSRPNAAVVSDWSRSGARPFSNSMMTAVYELLPNSTDLTVHLQQATSGVNIAISDGLEFYHTNRDDLAMLDRASVQHMGDQALGATRAFLASDWSNDRAAGEIAYSDIGSRLFVALPEPFALILLGLCFGVAAMMMVRPGRDSGWRQLDWRALALPPALYVASGVGAFLLLQGLSLVRSEPAFWTAHPQAFNMAIFALAALCGAAGLGWLARESRPELVFASGWFWFLVVGMGLSFAVAGFSMIFLIPGVAFVLAGGAAWLFPRYRLGAYAVASAMLALVFFPILHLLDVTMGLAYAPAFGVIAAMVLAPMLALVGPIRAQRVTVLTGLAAVVAIATAFTLFAPAYSVDRPLALNLTAHYDMDARKAALYAGARPGALPKAVRDQLTVGEIPSFPGAAPSLAARPLDFIERPSASATLAGETATQNGRSMSLQLSAPGARVVRLRIPAAAKLDRFRHAGRDYDVSPAGDYVIELLGRSGNSALVDLGLGTAGPADIIVQGVYPGLPPDARATADARPDTTVRIQMGDVTITTRRLAL